MAEIEDVLDTNEALIEQLAQQRITDAEDTLDTKNLLAWEASKNAVDDANAATTYAWETEVSRINTGIADRDTGYGAYLDAGSNATDFVDLDIAEERANAALMGVDYTQSADQRTARISDKFGQLWTGSQQAELEGLFQEFGAATGFNEWSYQRGQGGYYDARPGNEFIVSTSTGQSTIEDYEFLEDPTPEEPTDLYELPEWDTRTADDYGPQVELPELGDLLEYEERPTLTGDLPGGSRDIDHTITKPVPDSGKTPVPDPVLGDADYVLKPGDAGFNYKDYYNQNTNDDTNDDNAR